MSIVSVKPEISKESQHLSEEINSLQQLYEQGILTEEEFKKSKQKLLD
ncbi:SHOCT domain-containing protein [Vagococcus salmoninarum]|nr:SHOCT domain-containing protein [Vagococcus salmoninarum]MBE9390222.1 SHOCT domain-containing protein [Vagococcus salmoninarum]